MISGPNIFDCGGLNNTGHVTYCLDISGSMYLCLDTVKTHLIEHLRSRAADDEKRAANLFNLIAFSSEIYPWSNAVTLCNKSSVASAVDWIERLECKTGTNTLDAIVKAFEDEQTTSICLLTDDLCDQQPYVLLNRVSQISRGRPVHCIYLSSNRSDPSEHATIEYLHSLASITRGSFRIVTLGRRGLVEKITPIITQDMASTLQLANLSLHAMNTNISSSSSASILSVVAPSVVLATSNSMPNFARDDLNRVNVVHNRVVETATSNSQQRPTHDIAFSPEAGLMLVNRRVLARSKLDGYFYKGKVVNQILAHRFTVEFDVKKNAKDSYKTSDYQDTAIYDIIHFDDAIQHPIRVGDKVLALLDPESERYSPGEVLEGFAKRSSKDSTDITRADVNLIVRFSNGKTRTLTEQESPAIWLPDAAFDRLKFELNLPSNARQYVETLNTDYPLKSLPGYPAQPVKPFALSMPRLAYATWPFYVPYNPAYSVTTLPATTVIAPKETNTREVRVNQPNVDANTVSRELVITDRQEIKTDDLSRKIKEQIKLNEHLLNELDERKCRARSKSAERSCSCQQRQHQHVPVETTKHICNSDVKEALYENQYLNKYYEAYRQQIHDLYHDCHNQNQNYCHCHVRSHSPVESLIRSKSVSFCDSYRDSEHEEDVSLCSYHSKESTASKSKQHKKLVYTNVPNRFGNPKVSVGLPDRPVSSHANLGIKSKSISDLGPATKPLKSNQRVERWEKAHKEHIESEAKKSAARDQYKRTQMQNRSAALEKQEPQKPFHINRANIKTPTESSWEAKEEKKIAYMRSQAAKRDMDNMALQREQALKEANKLAYKKSQETKRNQGYHERLMAEEAWRQGEQRQSQLKFERVKLSHEAKENRERQRDELEKSLRHDKYIKMKNNLFY